MDLQTISVWKNEETAIFFVVKSCNLKNYLVHDNTYSNGQVSNKDRNLYRFPDKDVVEGELVELRSGMGNNCSDFLQMNGRKYRRHIFFWGLDRSVWNNRSDKLTLVEINKESHFKVD